MDCSGSLFEPATLHRVRDNLDFYLPFAILDLGR